MTTLTAVRLSGDVALPIVELSADGALPEPKVGVLDGPPRIYLDLAGVQVARPDLPAKALGVVTRVRAAPHSLSPLVTRVVIDLGESRAYKLDASQRETGLIRISITTAAPAHEPSSPRAAAPKQLPDTSEAAPERAPSSETKPGRASEAGSASPPTPRVPTAAPDALPTPLPRYRARVAPIVEQFETVRGVLESIDRRTDVPPDRLDVAARTIALVHDELDGVQPTRDAMLVHDTLRSACTLASTAVSLARAANGQEVPWNASSAAAGALLMFDRARAALQPR
ncbi:MAG: AMIN domain-containing protein [Vicinamibacterales bacterium]